MCKQVMQSIKPFLAEALAKVDQLKLSEADRSKRLDTVIEGFREDQARQKKAADASEAAALRGDNSHRQGEPVQIDSAPLSSDAPTASTHSLLQP